MCDYRYPNLETLHNADPILGPNPWCERKPTFWVQSLLSTHNAHACAHHLARIVRHIDECAKEFDIRKAGPRNPTASYAIDGVTGRMTKRESNYARVTVKPYPTTSGW